MTCQDGLKDKPFFSAPITTETALEERAEQLFLTLRYEKSHSRLSSVAQA